MKRLSILIFAALCAVACEKSDSQKPSRPYVIKASGITLPATVVKKVEVEASVSGYGTVAQAVIEDGGFELTLPATLPEQALFTVATDEQNKGATASDPQARLAFLTLDVVGDGRIAFDNSHLDESEGSVLIGSRQALFVYSDRPVTLTGESKWEGVAKIQLPGGMESVIQLDYTRTWADVSLEAGWNCVCFEANATLEAERALIDETISHKPLDDCRWSIYLFTNTSPYPIYAD
jgi:hypothetical protein